MLLSENFDFTICISLTILNLELNLKWEMQSAPIRSRLLNSTYWNKKIDTGIDSNFIMILTVFTHSTGIWSWTNSQNLNLLNAESAVVSNCSWQNLQHFFFNAARNYFTRLSWIWFKSETWMALTVWVLRAFTLLTGIINLNIILTVHLLQSSFRVWTLQYFAVLNSRVLGQ